MKKELTEAEIKRKLRKNRIRKRRFVIFLLFLLIMALGTFFVLLKTKLFPVKKIAVSGSELYSVQEIVHSSGIDKRTPLMSITEKSVLLTLRKELPYIETVKIKRIFPDTVSITVSDAKEVFVFSTDKGYYSVSESYRALNKYTEFPESLIVVLANDIKIKKGESVTFQNKEHKELFDFLYAYTKEKGLKLNAIDITNIVKITLKVEDRFEVNLGKNENIKEKIDHLASMVDEIGDRSGKINLEMWSKSDSKGTFIAEN